MKIVDLNIIIYAVNKDAPLHLAAKNWWEATLNQSETVGLSWVVILGFLRIITNPRIMPKPLSVEQSIDLVDSWLEQDVTQIIMPGNDHWSILRSSFNQIGVAANITTDAHLATLAIENGATLLSTDSDFSRFKNLKWINPLT